MFNNCQQCLDFIEQNNIQIIDFKMIDIDGKWRHVSVPKSKVSESLFTNGIGFDGSNYGYANVENSDMVFIPNFSSAFIDPFTKIKTLVMFGDVKTLTNKTQELFAQYPRNVLIKALEYLKQTNIADDMIIGPEFEFNLFDDYHYTLDKNEVSYTVNSQEHNFNENKISGKILPKDGYHVDNPNDNYSDVRSEMMTIMSQLGIVVKYHHHEVGAFGQQEIEVELDNVLNMADNTLLIEYIIRNIAHKNNLIATFMPKPVQQEPGNGLHVHMLLKKNNKNIFYDENGYGKLSDTAMYFIGGLLKHASSLCGITNCTTNSYRRLVKGYEAPVTIGYAISNRSAVIRIPGYVKNPEEVRFELRNPDATTNPYYCYAAILMAGIDGIINKINPKENNWGPFDFNLYELDDEAKQQIQGLPTNLQQALTALEEDNEYLLANGVFNKDIIDSWIRRKTQQANSIESIPHPAEIAYYL